MLKIFFCGGEKSQKAKRKEDMIFSVNHIKDHGLFPDENSSYRNCYAKSRASGSFY